MGTHLSALLLLVSILAVSHCQFFSSDPVNQTVVVGNSALLACGSRYVTSETCPHAYTLSWIYRPSGTSPTKRVSDCGTMYSPFDQRMITAGENSRHYYLYIPKAQLLDSGQYWCQLYFSTGQLYYSTAKAWLAVNPPLPSFLPSCEVQPQESVVGTEVSLTCTLNIDDPTSFLTWYEATSSANEQLTISSQNTQPGETYTIQQVLRPSDNMQEFTCTAGPHTDGPSCSLVPLEIRPLATISPPYLTLREGERAAFTCDFETIPPEAPDRIGWLVDLEGSWVDVEQDGPDNRFELAPGGQDLEIPNVTVEGFDKARIRCIAFLNEDRYQSVNDSFLTVLPAVSPNDHASAGDSAGAIVGGTLAVVLSLVGIVLLLVVCWVKIKQNQSEKEVDNRMEMSGSHDLVANSTTQPENVPTYEDILHDNEQPPPDPPNETVTNRNPPDTEGVTYTFPGHTGSGRIRRYKVPVAANDQSAPPVNGRASRPPGVSSEQVIYDMPYEDKETPTAPASHAPSCSRAQEGGVGTTEGAVTDAKQNMTAGESLYAELIDDPLVTRTSEARIEQAAVPVETSGEIVYAEIHNDP